MTDLERRHQQLLKALGIICFCGSNCDWEPGQPLLPYEAANTTSWWGVVSTSRRWPPESECDMALWKHTNGTYSYIGFISKT